MRVVVNNIRGIKSADLDLVPGEVVLVGAQNGAGKSSLVQSIAAVLSGEPLPEGMAKKDAAALVHEGEESGFVSVETDDGAVGLTLPDAKLTSRGTPPRASAIACGLRSIVDMKPAERIQVLVESLNAAPQWHELVEVCREAGVAEHDETKALRLERASEKAIAAYCKENGRKPDEMHQLAQALHVNGWDGLWAQRKDHGKALKGAWSQITGKTYGSEVGATWRPADYPEALSGASLEALRQKATDAHAAVDAALKRAGASEADRSAKVALVAEMPALRTKQRAAAAALHAAQADAAEAQAELNALPSPPDEEKACACPHCQKPVVVDTADTGYRLRAPSATLTAEQVKDRRRARAEACGKLGRLEGVVPGARAAAATAQAELDRAVAAEAWLADNPEGPAETVDVAALRATADAVSRNLQLFEQCRQALAKHREIAGNQILIDALAPTGLRRKALGECLELFNGTQLAELSGIAGWAPVTIHLAGSDGVDIRYGGRPYALLSSSEKWRARAILQVAQARNEQAALILIDGGDILVSPDSRRGLLDLTIEQPCPVVVTIAYAEAANAPDLGRAGLGSTVWIEDGVARVTSAARAAAQAAE